jgi:hypothetical protein
MGRLYIEIGRDRDAEMKRGRDADREREEIGREGYWDISI